jgi:hypothetical protein
MSNEDKRGPSSRAGQPVATQESAGRRLVVLAILSLTIPALPFSLRPDLVEHDRWLLKDEDL